MGIVHSHEDEDKLAFLKKMQHTPLPHFPQYTLLAPENFA